MSSATNGRPGPKPGELLLGPDDSVPAPEQTKQCRQCGEVKPLQAFHRGGTRKCKDCLAWNYVECKQAGKCWSHATVDVMPGYSMCATCLLAKSKSNARRRRLCWRLSDEQALHIMSMPCAYCGGPGGGIDRRKNEYGYTILNSVPCCAGCNSAKEKDTAKTYIERCHKVSKHCVDRETFMRRNAELQKQLKEFETWQSESTSVEPAEPVEK